LKKHPFSLRIWETYLHIVSFLNLSSCSSWRYTQDFIVLLILHHLLVLVLSSSSSSQTPKKSCKEFFTKKLIFSLDLAPQFCYKIFRSTSFSLLSSLFPPSLAHFPRKTRNWTDRKPRVAAQIGASNAPEKWDSGSKRSNFAWKYFGR